MIINLKKYCTKYVCTLVGAIGIIGTFTYLEKQKEDILLLNVEVKEVNAKLQTEFAVSLQEYRTVEESIKLENTISIPNVRRIESNCTDCNLTFNINSKGVTLEEN